MCSKEHVTDGYTFLHDFALTPTHYVLVQNPVLLDAGPFIMGKSGAAASVKWVDGKPSEVHMLKRPVVKADTVVQQQPQLQQQPSQLQQQPPQLQQSAHSSNENGTPQYAGKSAHAGSQLRRGGSSPGSANLPDYLMSKVSSAVASHHHHHQMLLSNA